MNILLIGAAVWMATTIVVESELFRPLRDFIAKREARAYDDVQPTVVAGGNLRPVLLRAQVWGKLRYAASCHLCTGTWIALGVALWAPIWGGFIGWVVSGLAYKAIAHLILELRPQAWYEPSHQHQNYVTLEEFLDAE